jgi:hypothetical protein
MEQKTASTEDHSLANELKVGVLGLGMAAVLISIFLTIMFFLSNIVHTYFGNSLPFVIDKG